MIQLKIIPCHENKKILDELLKNGFNFYIFSGLISLDLGFIFLILNFGQNILLEYNGINILFLLKIRSGDGWNKKAELELD